MPHITDQAADALVQTGAFALIKNTGYKAFAREVETATGVKGVLLYVAYVQTKDILERDKYGHCRSPQSR